MAATTRTFVAIEMPAPVQAALRAIQERLEPDAPGVRWVGATAGFHLTLAFLGDVSDKKLDAVCRAVIEAAAPFDRLALQVEGLGAFPNPSRPRIVWAGLGGPGLANLNELRNAIATVLQRAGLPPADERFTPHVTLGRVKPGRGRPPDLTAVLARPDPLIGPAFEVTEVAVFASNPGPAGPSYTPLAHAPLNGRKPPIAP